MAMTEEELCQLEQLSRACLSTEVAEQTVKRLTAEVRRLLGVLSTYMSAWQDQQTDLLQLRDTLRASSALLNNSQRMAAEVAEQRAACEERCNRLLRLLGAEMAKTAGIDG